MAFQPPHPASTDQRGLARFSRLAACWFVGLAPSALANWERAASREAGVILPASLGFTDLLALAVLAEVDGRLGAQADDYTAGLALLFTVLAAADDPERLDDRVALIGRDSARLGEVGGDAEGGVIVIPLHPILESLRDQVFS